MHIINFFVLQKNVFLPHKKYLQSCFFLNVEFKVNTVNTSINSDTISDNQH